MDPLVDLNLFVLWTVVLSFTAALVIHRRRRRSDRPTPWPQFLAAAPVTAFTVLLLLHALLAARGRFSVATLVVLAFLLVVAAAAAALDRFWRTLPPASLVVVLLLLGVPLFLAFVPGLDLHPVADALLLFLALAAAAALPASLAAAKRWPARTRAWRSLVVALLFAAIVVHGLGLAAALERPFTETRRDLVLDLELPEGRNVTLSIFFPGLLPGLGENIYVTSGEATVAGQNPDLLVRSKGPARVEAHERFYSSRPAPAESLMPVFINASANLTLHVQVFSGQAGGHGCTITIDQLLDIRPHRTYPIEPVRTCPR